MGGCLAAALAATALPAPAFAAPQGVAAALQSSVKSGSDLKAFYKARRYRPLWVRDGSPGPEAERLVHLVASAELDGLDPGNYEPRALLRAMDNAGSGSPKALARAEILLSRAFAAYVRDVRHPPSVGMVYLDRELAPALPTAGAVLASAAAAPSLMRHLEDMEWANPVYVRLREGLADHRERWSGLPRVEIPTGPSLKPGASGARVRMLRQRLGLMDNGAFDKNVTMTVREFQAAHGLPDDGVVGPLTIAALNRSPEHHERLIRLNLERARALPANLGRRHIVVDAASARLWLYEDGRVRDTMRVIVGKPEEPTPMLAGMMRYAIVNPYWNVPHDLVRIRIAPNVLGKGVSYLKTMRYEVLSDWSADGRVIDPKTVDWEAVAAGREELRVRQRPGRDNAMGDMKFMMPNDLGIYLHDTPDKALFRDDDRRFSSGCVRVEDARRLAKWLFGKPLVARSDAPEQRIALPEPVPVYLTYFTAAPAEQGIAFREDAYNRDKAQLAKAGAQYAAGVR